MNRRLLWSPVRQGKMPLPKYTALQREARLSDEDRELISLWVESAATIDLDPFLMSGR